MEQNSIPDGHTEESAHKKATDEQPAEEATHDSKNHVGPSDGNDGKKSKSLLWVFGVIEFLALVFWMLAELFDKRGHYNFWAFFFWLAISCFLSGAAAIAAQALGRSKSVWTTCGVLCLCLAVAVFIYSRPLPELPTEPIAPTSFQAPVVVLVPVEPPKIAVKPFGFRKKHDEIELLIGSSTLGLPPVPHGATVWKDVGRAFFGIGSLEHPSDIGMIADENQILFNIKFAPIFGMPALVLTNNEISGLPSNWDFNHSTRAIEVVNENLFPVFHLYYKDDTHLVFSGIITFSNDFNKGAVVISESNEIKIITGNLNPSNDIKTLNLKRIFKYPAWKYPGQFSDE